MVAGMRAMFGHDLEHRVNALKPGKNLEIAVHLIEEEVVCDHEDATVTAFPVEHDDGNPDFGYRIACGNCRVVLSVGTTFHENLIIYGRGADLMVQNVIIFSDGLSREPEMKGVLAKLTTPEQAVRIFLRVPLEWPSLRTLWLRMCRLRVWRIRLSRAPERPDMGDDRMVIVVGDEIAVRAPKPIDDLPMLDSKVQEVP